MSSATAGATDRGVATVWNFLSPTPTSGEVFLSLDGSRPPRVLGMIKRTIRFKDTRIMLSLYKTLVRPHVEYCVSAWNPYYKKTRN